MKFVTRLAAVAAFSATILLINIASAADIVVEDDRTPVEVVQDYRYFIAVRANYGPMLEENAFSAPGLGATGHFEDDTLAGILVEAGVFFTPHWRVSGELTLGRIDHEIQFLNGAVGPVPLTGHTNAVQGFAKIAYEVGLDELGLTSPFLSRMKVFGVAGIGFSYLENDAVLLNPFLPGGPAVADSSDTILQGKVGFGSIYQLTENIDIMSEYNYIFGGNGDFTIRNGVIGTQPVSARANAHSGTVGFRYRF